MFKYNEKICIKSLKIAKVNEKRRKSGYLIAFFGIFLIFAVYFLAQETKNAPSQRVGQHQKADEREYLAARKQRINFKTRIKYKKGI